MARFNLRSMRATWPAHGWLGFTLVLVFWIINWSWPGLRTHWAFFPLWLGYSLLVDALVQVRKGDSMLSRHPRAFLLLFVLSMPTWWLFELLNWRVQNWQYDGRQFFTDLEYLLLASLSFSTVMPAVFGTAELASTWDRLRRLGPGLRIRPTKGNLSLFFVIGWLMLASLLIWPDICFPFLWLSIYFILEPLNVWLKHDNLARHTAEADWRPVLALWLGCLICSFFWEMWNFYSYPKWTYQVPFVDFWRVFEMPLLGYGGYLPFSLELFALYHLITSLLGLEKVQLFSSLSER